MGRYMMVGGGGGGASLLFSLPVARMSPGGDVYI